MMCLMIVAVVTIMSIVVYQKLKHRPGGTGWSWDDVAWDDMAPIQQHYWRMLGWNRASWSGYAPEPATSNLSWYQLSQNQRYAAYALGYTPARWDQE